MSLVRRLVAGDGEVVRVLDLKSILHSQPSYAVLDNVFYIGTSRIENKKDVIPYIRSAALGLLKDRPGKKSDDFYFAYTYENQICNFFVTRSKRHLAGSVPPVLPAFQSPGQYLYRVGQRQVVIEHFEDGTVVSSLNPEQRTGCIDLTDFADEDELQDIPPTFRLQWSLAQRDFNTNLILALVLVLAVCNYLYQGMRYEEVTSRAQDLVRKNIEAQTVASQQVESNLGMLPDLIRELSQKMGGEGSISSLRYEGGKLGVILDFANEDAARQYVKKNGGAYVEGKVVLGDGAVSVGDSDTHNQGRPGEKGR